VTPLARRLCLSIGAAVAAAACVDRLPDQDLRIVSATAVVKMPVEDFAKEYQTDRAAADRRYFGKAVELSGKVADVHEAASGSALTFNDRTGAEILEAVLLDDQAKAIAGGLDDTRRVRLKCYADKFAAHVLVRSCVKP